MQLSRCPALCKFTYLSVKQLPDQMDSEVEFLSTAKSLRVLSAKSFQM